MMDMVAICAECGCAWDTWIGNICPNCHTPLPPEIAAEADRIASDAFLGVESQKRRLSQPQPEPEPESLLKRFLNWLDF